MSDVVAELMRAAGAFADPTLDLLHQKDAHVVTAIFTACFPRDARSVPVDRMHTLVEQMLDDLRAAGHAQHVPDRAGKDLCERWRSKQWLVREPEGESGGEVYRLTSAAQSALTTVRSLTRERTSVSEHRISTIVATLRALNAKANPDRLARLEVLQEEADRIAAQIEHLTSGAPMPTPSEEYLLEGFLDLLVLIGDLPGDFQRVQESFIRQRAQVLEQFRAEEQTAGQVVDRYLQQADALMDTPEGRAFQGALELLRDREMLDRLGSDLDDLLKLPVSGDILTVTDRSELAGVVYTLTDGIADVVARRQRVTAVLRQNIHTYNAEQDRRLESVLHQLDAAFVPWLATTGARTAVPLKLLPQRPEIKHLRERMHDPREEAPLDPLPAASANGAGGLTLEQIRALGGPDMAVLRHHLEQAWASGTHPSLAAAFASLPVNCRRPADLLGALQVATDSALIGWAPGFDLIETTRPDGTVRTWKVPRALVAAASRPTDEEALAALVDELTQETA